MLLTLWDYMSTPEQIKRMQDVINNPELINAPDGQMNAVHIRFDSNSSVMADVQEGGKPQLWNHKQNDALRLYLDILIQAVDTGIIKAEDWEKGDRLKSVVLLVAYLDKVCFTEWKILVRGKRMLVSIHHQSRWSHRDWNALLHYLPGNSLILLRS